MDADPNPGVLWRDDLWCHRNQTGTKRERLYLAELEGAERRQTGFFRQCLRDGDLHILGLLFPSEGVLVSWSDPDSALRGESN